MSSRPLSRVLPPILLAMACNQPPSQPTVSISPADPGTLDALTVEYDGAEDPNANDTVSYGIRWFKDGEAQAGLDDVGTVPISATSKGETWKVVVTPTDGSAVGDGGEASVTVRNTLPEVEIEVDPAAPSTLDVVRATASASDADLDRTTLRYQWTVNGSVTAIDGASLAPADTQKGQVWEIAVFASDDEGEGQPTAVTFTIENTVPRVTSARIIPADPDRDSVLECEGSGWSDADGDDEAYQTEWLVDDAVVSTDPALPGSGLERGDRVQCRLTPDDGDGLGSPVISPVLVFGNTLPVLASVTIGPEDPVATDSVTATLGEATDADGDEVTVRYSWRVDGKEVATTEALSPSRFYKDGAIQLRATPSDGYSDGAFVDSNVIYGGNNPPAIDSVAVIPDPLYTSDLAEADVVATDRDGDTLALTYAWYVDGALVGSSSTLDGTSDFERGDAVHVVVTADDGDLESDAATAASVTVQNSPPTEPELVWDVTEPDPAADLQCVIDVDSTDDDSGDSVSYTFRWELDGSALGGAKTTTHTGDTMPAGSWSKGDDMRCYVTATDGIDAAAEVQLRLPIVPPCTKSTVKTDTDGRIYVLCDELETFDDALAACRSMGGSWDLASVRSSTENAWLDKAVDGTLTNGAGNPFCWIGFTDEDVEGTWVWTDGSKVSYTGWISPEPNGGSSQNCVMFRAGSTWKGTWNDIGCSNKNPYVCSEP